MRTTVNLTLLVIVGSLVIASCGQKQENERLQGEVDSLSVALDQAQKAVTALDDIGELLDTIESQRDIIRMEMVEGGISREDYTSRIQYLNQLIDEAEGRIGDLETANTAYASLVAKLKKELDDRNRELDAMEAVLDTYKAENISMESTIILQENEIEELETQIQVRQAELMLLENQVEEMIDEMQLKEADAYYARAVAYEEAANRTKLAPRKKKETLQQALDLYKQALALGNEAAEPKVTELEAKLD